MLFRITPGDLGVGSQLAGIGFDQGLAVAAVIRAILLVVALPGALSTHVLSMNLVQAEAYLPFPLAHVLERLADRQFLTDFYAEDIRKLERLTERDLSSWLLAAGDPKRDSR